MKKKILTIFNYSMLGGAEKSAIEQIHFLSKDFTIDALVPNYSSENKSFSELENVKGFYFPSSFSKLSRTSENNYLLSSFSFALGVLRNTFGVDLKSYDIVWLNGLKVFILFLPCLILKGRSKKIIVSVRDYWPNHFSIRFILFWIELLNLNIKFMCNSKSVKMALSKSYPSLNSKSLVVYNICKKQNFSSAQKDIRIKTLGVSSMLAPWKGVQSLLIFAKLFEVELKELGIERIKIYGDSIYSTKGEHLNYKEELFQLKSKLDIKLIEFEGLKSTSEIFESVDLLIHPSIKPEPFGRVIVEAYANDVLLLSSGLGGSEEILVEDSKIIVNDYFDLFTKIQKLTQDQEYVNQKIAKQREFYSHISRSAQESLSFLFGLE